MVVSYLVHVVSFSREDIKKCQCSKKASPSDSDWQENLSDKFTLKQIVKTAVQPEKSWFDLTGFKTYFEH